MKFILTDIEYKNAIILLGDTNKGERAVIKDELFKPYFYSNKKPEMISIGEHKIESIIKEEEKYKVILNKPESIPIIKEELERKGIKITEADIPFTQRYLIDKELKMLEGVDSETLNKCEMKWDPRVLAFDIETSNTNGVPNPEIDQVLMISLWSNYGIQKVLISKNCNEPKTECYKNEKEILEAFNKIIEESKPNIIVTYNGDNFDWPFLRDRMNKHKISRYYGYDGSPMTIIKKKIGSSARIKGLAHVDLYMFVSKLLSAQLKTNSLTLGNVSKELINNTKKEMDWDEFYKDWEAGQLKKIVDYSITDAQVTYELFDKLKTIMFELTKLVNEPLYETSRSSYSTLVENYLINRAKELKQKIPPRPSGDDVSARTRISFTGGYVYPPKPGVYEKIAVMDFRSLYPTIIVSYNICPTTINKKGIKIDVEGKKYEYSTETGFIPLVVKDLVETRAKIKKELKNNKDAVLEARSNAVKTITNATYGYLSYPRSRWYCFDCAQTITALGRKHIKEVIEEAKKAGFGVCYGDTDSAFLTMGEKTKKELEEFVEQINKKLPGIMELELERICPRGLFVASKKGDEGVKKRYALIDDKGELIIKGFEFVRGDWSNISKETQYKVFNAILKENNRNKAINEVKEIISKIRKNEVQLKELVIRTQLTMELKDYKNIGPHVEVAKRLAKQGRPITAGTMVEYIIVEGKGLMRDKARTIDEVKKEGLKPDADYYVNKQIIPTVDRILDAINSGEIDKKEQKGLKEFF